MSSIASTTPAGSTFPAPLFSFPALLAALFMVNLREKIDADTGGDKSDAAYAYGL